MFQIISAILIVFLLFQMRKKYQLSRSYRGHLYEDEIAEEGIVDETEFWELISESYSSNYNIQIQNLSEVLTKMSSDRLQVFQNTLDLLMAKSYQSKLWNKAYALNMGCSDDCFEYFRTWLIAQGKDKFYNTMSDPSYLLYFGKKEMVQNYEGLGYVAQEVATQRGLALSRHPNLPEYEINDPETIEDMGVQGLFLSLMAWLN